MKNTVASRRYRLAPAAEQDIEGIWLYTAKQWSPVKANAYIRDFLSAFSDLAAGERSGTPVFGDQSYHRLIVGSHLILYRLSASRIDIIRILHQSMDLPRHLT